MSEVLNYQLSIFGDFQVEAKPEVIAEIMKRLNDGKNTVFLPQIIPTQKLDITTNRVSPVSSVGFITQDQRYQLAILGGRIDFMYVPGEEEVADLDAFAEIAVPSLAAITKYINAKANRLALNVQRAEKDTSPDVIEEVGKKVVSSPEFYSGKKCLEWAMRVNAREDIKIGESTEPLNVITNISADQNLINKKFAIMIHFDINTCFQNQALRFTEDDLAEFVRLVKPLVEELTQSAEGMLR